MTFGAVQQEWEYDLGDPVGFQNKYLVNITTKRHITHIFFVIVHKTTLNTWTVTFNFRQIVKPTHFVWFLPPTRFQLGDSQFSNHELLLLLRCSQSSFLLVSSCVRALQLAAHFKMKRGKRISELGQKELHLISGTLEAAFQTSDVLYSKLISGFGWTEEPRCVWSPFEVNSIRVRSASPPSLLPSFS